MLTQYNTSKLCLDGKWITADLGPDAQGRFVRRATQFRGQLEANGPYPVADIGKDRYLLLIGSPCGWSHCVILVRALMGLEDCLPVIFTDAFMGEGGWTFYGHNSDNEEEKKGGIMASELYLDPVGAGYTDPTQIVAQKMYEAYVLAKSDYTGRCSVPVLWERQTGTIVNNESSDLIAMLSSENVKSAAAHPVNLVPDDLKASI